MPNRDDCNEEPEGWTEAETEPEDRREPTACGWCCASGLELRQDGAELVPCRFCRGEGGL